MRDFGQQTSGSHPQRWNLFALVLMLGALMFPDQADSLFVGTVILVGLALPIRGESAAIMAARRNRPWTEELTMRERARRNELTGELKTTSRRLWA